MEEVHKNVVAMVEQQQAGIPLKKLALYYQQTYHSNLCLASLGFASTAGLLAYLDRDLIVEGKKVFHKTHYHTRMAGSALGVSTPPTEDNIKMVLENVVSLVKQQKDGIPIQKLAVIYNRTYNTKLILAPLGFDTMASLVASLHSHLVVEGELVFHKDHPFGSQGVAGAGSGTSAETTEDSEMIEVVLENVLALIKERPHGIPLKSLAKVYRQKYHRHIALSLLGFKSISALVVFLKGDLVLKDQVVFHKIHQPQNQPESGNSTNGTKNSRSATPQETESLSGDTTTTPTVTRPKVDVSPHHVPLAQAGISPLDPPLHSTASLLTTPGLPDNLLFAASKPAEQLTQQQLYQRVLEVSYFHKYMRH